MSGCAPQRVALELVRTLAAGSRPRRIRTLREFAEQEVVIPDGPFAHRKFSVRRQPYTGLLLDAIDGGQWRVVNVTGPTQSGKTLCAAVIPIMYSLFELRETVVFGVPTLEMGRDKWLADILPAVEASRFREYLPRSGGGARGGNATYIRFGNGAALRFMTGGGGDKTAAGFTSRIVVITETDGMDEIKAGSEETDRVSQLRARTRAYGARARIFQECTVTTKQGRTWRDYVGGTESRIACPCVHCGAWVTPEREHLVGWQSAPTAVEARALATWACPECGAVLSEDERRAMNLRAVLVHRGQRVAADGRVAGDAPRTDVLGFRWNAWNNLFVTAGDVAAAEWAALRAVDEEAAERDLRQFWWAIPHEPQRSESLTISYIEVMHRQRPERRGVLPDGAPVLTVGVDIGKRLLHWVALATAVNCRIVHVCDYGRVEAPSDDVAEERALLLALRELRDLVSRGWLAPDGAPALPAFVLIDAGWRPDVIDAFMSDAHTPPNWVACKGYGAGQEGRVYRPPKATGGDVVFVGDGCDARWRAEVGRHFVNIAVDRWKTWVASRLDTGARADGALTLFVAARPQEHMTIARHLTAERQVTEWVAGKGDVVRWERVHRSNHFLDALVLAAVGAHLAGSRVVSAAPPRPVAEAPPPIERPRRGVGALFESEFEPYFVLER